MMRLLIREKRRYAMNRNSVLGLILLLAFLAPSAQAAGGWFVFQTEITNANEQIILPAGTFVTTDSLENGVSLIIALSQSVGKSRLFSMNLKYSAGLTESGDLEGLRFELESNGSLTVRRLSGTGDKTYSLTVRGIWIS
jgi:hypothetical protein